MQQLVLDPLGVVTQANKFGQTPAGAMVTAHNVRIRSPGIVEAQRAWSTIATLPSTDAGTTCAFIVPTPGRYMLVVFNVTAGWRYCWFDMGAGGAAAFGGAKTLAIEDGTAQSVNLTRQPSFSAVQHGEQLFLSTYSQVMVWDKAVPTTTAEATVRRAGLQPPWFQQVYPDPNGPGTSGTALEAEQWCVYTAVFRRTVGDKEIVSEPSAAVSFMNWNEIAQPTPLACNCRLTLAFTSVYVRAGDRLEVYRTRSKHWDYQASYNKAQNGEEVGSEFLRALTYTLTASDVSAGQVVLNDSTPDTGLTQALYTNQSVGGAGAAAGIPPAARALAVYKSHLFAFGPTYPGETPLRVRAVWQYLGDAPSDVQDSGIGDIDLDLSWSSGSTTVTVNSGGTEAAAIGQRIQLGTQQRYITAVNPGVSITVDVAPTTSGSGAFTTLSDTLWVSGTGIFAASWNGLVRDMVAAHQLHAISLQLPPFNCGGAGITASPTDFLITRTFLDDARTPLQLSASRPLNWDPDLVTPPSVRSFAPKFTPYAYAWGEQNQPENFPRINIDSFTQAESHVAVGTRDALIVFCGDGIWRLSGNGGSAGEGYDWRADQLATDITVSGSQAVCVLHDDVYAYTSRGLVVISGGTNFTLLTEGRLNDRLSGPPWADSAYGKTAAVWLAADEEHGEIHLHEEEALTDGSHWVYNVATNTFVTTQSHAFATDAKYSPYVRAMVVVGNDTGNTWTLKAPTGSYSLVSTLGFQPVYGDNPFTLKHWSVLDVALSAASSASVTAAFNTTTGQTIARSNDASEGFARMRFDVPRASPNVCDSMRLTLAIVPNASTGFQLQGFALGIRPLTERSPRV